MPDQTAFPQAEPALHRFHRSGWSMGETAFTGPSGRTVHQVDGANGENRIRVEGATPAEAWHRAVEAAASSLKYDAHQDHQAAAWDQSFFSSRGDDHAGQEAVIIESDGSFRRPGEPRTAQRDAHRR